MALPDDIAPTDLPSGLPSELLARRPDIRAAEQMLIGANANIERRGPRSSRRLASRASAGTASASLDGLFDSPRGPGASCRRSRCIHPRRRVASQSDVAQVPKRIEIANYEKSIQAALC